MAWGSWGYYEEEEQADYDKTQLTEAEVFKKGKWPFGVKGKLRTFRSPRTQCAHRSATS